MPPRIPRQKAARKANVKQKQAGHSPDKEKDKNENKDKDRNSESDASEYKIVDGREEILQTWLAELTMNEKRAVLDITTDELIAALQRAGYEQVDGKVDELLDNHELMTALRKSFVDAIHARGVMEVPNSIDPILITLISLLEHHLITIHTRKLMAYKGWLFIMAIIWFSTYWWLWRYSAILLTLYSGYSSYPRIIHAKEQMLSVFEDPSPHRMKARLHSFLSGIMCIFLCDWLPSSQYKLVLLLLVLPLILIEIEKSTATTTDENALRYIRSFLLYVSEICTLYFAWWSWTMTLFVCLFFFPSLSCVLIAGTCMIASIAFPIFSQIQSFFIPVERHPFLLWIGWILSIFTFYYTWTTSGWILSIFHIFIILLLHPPLVSQVITVSCSGMGGALLSMGIGGVLTTGLQIGSVLLLALVITGVNKIVPPIVQRLCPRYAHRFKQEDEESEH